MPATGYPGVARFYNLPTELKIRVSICIRRNIQGTLKPIAVIEFKGEAENVLPSTSVPGLQGGRITRAEGQPALVDEFDLCMVAAIDDRRYGIRGGVVGIISIQILANDDRAVIGGIRSGPIPSTTAHATASASASFLSRDTAFPTASQAPPCIQAVIRPGQVAPKRRRTYRGADDAETGCVTVFPVFT